MLTEFQKIKHLFLRAGCGSDVSILKQEETLDSYIEKIFSGSKDYKEIDVTSGGDPDNTETAMESIKMTMDTVNENEMDKTRAEYRSILIYNWMNNFAFGEGFLREKMAIFWGLHFACKMGDPLICKRHLNMLRENSLGKFKDLVAGVATSSGMISYLNINVSVKEQPNENFARELMEIFTLGAGNFTEDDVKNSARAFTGWNFDKQSLNFFIDPAKHDFGEKTFLGETGNFGGFEIIEIILKQKQCARFIVNKIYKFFVNDKVNETIAGELADYFYSTDYDIELLMKKIFTSDFFYNIENIGAKLKTPYELMGGVMKFYNLKFDDYRSFSAFNKFFGHDIFHPPTVAGWNFERGSMDSSSLLIRLDTSRRIFESRHYRITDLESGKPFPVSVSDTQLSHAAFNIAGAKAIFEKGDPKLTTKNLIDFLIQIPHKKFTEQSSFITGIEYDFLNISRLIMSTPEYQFC